MFTLDYASGIAARLTSIIRPYCDAVVVAGSIRRRRPQVKDIDLVVIPNSLSGLAMALLKRGEILTKKRLDSKTKIIKAHFEGVPVDIYLADKETWATILLIRTGSADHNKRLAMKAKRLDLHLKANGEGILDGDGRKISGDTEQSIFAALGMEWVPPEKRE